MTLSGILEERVAVPKGVTVTINGSIVEVKGPKGKLSRDFYNPKTKVSLDGDELVVSCEMPRVKDKAMIGTFASHLNNMIDGVTAGFEYHMKIVFSHFPIKTAVKGDRFVIENFLGERAPRTAKILGDTKIVVKGNDVVLEKMMRMPLMTSAPDASELLEDVMIENRQAMEMCTIYRDILAGIMDAYASVISNNLNIVMKVLTSLTVVMSIPTIFSSLWGMNVKVPFGDNPYGFYIVVGFSILVAIVAFIFLWRKKMF